MIDVHYCYYYLTTAVSDVANCDADFDDDDGAGDDEYD